MKNLSDHNRLLDDLLGEDFRAESLTHTLAAARRERKLRRLRSQIAGTAGVMLLAAVLLFPRGPRKTAPIVTQPGPSKSAIRVISEDELLAQFPGRAVGIVGPPERRQLVFLDRF